jgi:hypothetical protein
MRINKIDEIEGRIFKGKEKCLSRPRGEILMTMQEKTNVIVE